MKRMFGYVIVRKLPEGQEITYQNDLFDGFDMTPKKALSGCVSVDRLALLSPLLIAIMVQKKVNRLFDRLFKRLTLLLSSDDDTGTAYREALNEIEKFRLEIKNKYRKYMAVEELHVMGKKLSILRDTAQMQLASLQEEKVQEKSGKAR